MFDKRAFQVVAHQLELPVTCVSTAYGLKCAYERPSNLYEQCLVPDRRPRNKKTLKQEELPL